MRNLEHKSHIRCLLPASLEANTSSLAASVGTGIFPRGGEVKTVLLILAFTTLLLSFLVKNAAEAPVAAGLGAGGVGYFNLLACVGRGAKRMDIETYQVWPRQQRARSGWTGTSRALPRVTCKKGSWGT